MIFSLFDTETTDLTLHPQADLDKQPRIVEFAGVHTDGNDILRDVQFLCNPHRRIAPAAAKVNGLSEDDLFDKPNFAHYLDVVQPFFQEAQVVIAHNLSFDKQMMTVEATHMGVTLETFSWPAIEICTVEQTFPMFGRRMKLEKLYEIRFGEYKQKHRARDDLNLLHAICKSFGVYDAIKRSLKA